MKAKRLSEVRALVAHPEFQDWWHQLQAARAEHRAALERYDELLSQTTLTEFRAELTQKNAIDTLYRAGESEDAAAKMLFEATGLENRSFQAIAEFEEQRYRVSELWYRLGAAEKDLEEKQEQYEKAKAKRGDGDLKLAEKAHRAAKDLYERESALKNRLWDQVEGIWDKSAEVGLLVTEHRAQGKKVRRQAESLFALAEQRKLKGKQLRAEAEAAAAAVDGASGQIDALLGQAKDRFGCSAGVEFLYFRQRDQKLAYCVALVEDSENYNIEVRPLSIYSVDRQRGVAFLEPAGAEPPPPEEGDRRFEQYFLTGRKGEVRVTNR